MTSHYWIGTGVVVKGGGVKLVFMSKIKYD
jgi:hypothetical protein